MSKTYHITAADIRANNMMITEQTQGWVIAHRRGDGLLDVSGKGYPSKRAAYARAREIMTDQIARGEIKGWGN